MAAANVPQLGHLWKVVRAATIRVGQAATMQEVEAVGQLAAEGQAGLIGGQRLALLDQVGYY